MTYSDKYALLKAYKMITGDDPDQHKSEEENWNLGNNKVTDIEAKSIYAMMTKKGWNVVELLEKNYGIKNTSELTKEQYASILKALNDNKDN